MVEVIASLVLAGIIAAIAAMGIASFTNGFVTVKENSKMMQNAQMALTRLNQEFMELTDIAAKSDTQPDPWVIYDHITERRAIAKDGSIIKMFFNLPSGTVTIPSTGGNTLIDNVESLTFNYYKDYLVDPKIPWVLGTDNMDLLTIIRVELELTGFTDTFYTVVFPRNK